MQRRVSVISAEEGWGISVASAAKFEARQEGELGYERTRGRPSGNKAARPEDEGGETWPFRGADANACYEGRHVVAQTRSRRGASRRV